MRLFLVLTALCSQTLADIYLHNPRGCNDRLNEKSANRANANRMFDSQNNNRGGYNVADATKDPAGNDESKQYSMKYFQSSAGSDSLLTVEWTNQHGCGGNEDDNPNKLNCRLVLQYMCQEDSETQTLDTIRNGVKTNTQDYTRPPNSNYNLANRNTRKTANVKSDRGLHETWNWYERCFVQERNKGLFTADQNLKANNGLGYSAAIYTRQNPNGNRRGYECPEERDYFPYWHPTPWKDIAILAENETLCGMLQDDSFNTKPYGACVEKFANSQERKPSRYNNPADCAENNGVWTEFHNYLEKVGDGSNSATCLAKSTATLKYIFAIPHDSTTFQPECLLQLPVPDCQEAPWSRSNHLGNGIGGEPNTVTWKIPYFPSGDTMKCVLRMRYNISTDDYDPFNTDSSFNGAANSPVTNNPYVDIGLGRGPLRLAINTAQFGRVFQDRTHKFLLRPRPAEIEDGTLYNINVRGKRGNIVQVYPAVEYDFVPTHLEISENDMVHIQWAGSNTHNNGRPGGDGQTGDAGEGKTGTDRHNILQMADRNENYPLPFEKTTMWDGAEIKWIYHGKADVSARDLAINMASSGYYKCVAASDCPAATFTGFLVETKAKMQTQLDTSPASYEGAVLKYKQGTYHYMCTRNNNFTNRSQKATIEVK